MDFYQNGWTVMDLNGLVWSGMDGDGFL